MKNIFLSFLIVSGLLLSSCEKAGLSSSNSNQTSTGGSLARFTIVNNYLYTIGNQTLKSYDIGNPANPVFKSEMPVGRDIETIYPFKDKLFIGSNQAMYVYSLTNPGKPEPLSQTSYVLIRGRDPVVANDTIAFSTLRNFAGIGGTMNIIDIKNVLNPMLMGSIGMEEPYGLGFKDDVLYVCEGSKGMKIFKTNEVLRSSSALIKRIQTGDTFYDVIPYQQNLYAFIKDGFIVFNIADAKNPIQLARITN